MSTHKQISPDTNCMEHFCPLSTCKPRFRSLKVIVFKTPLKEQICFWKKEKLMTVFLCGRVNQRFCLSQQHHRSFGARPLLLFSDFPNSSSTWSSVHTHGNHSSFFLFTVKTKEKQTPVRPHNVLFWCLSYPLSPPSGLAYLFECLYLVCIWFVWTLKISRSTQTLLKLTDKWRGRTFTICVYCMCGLGSNRTSKWDSDLFPLFMSSNSCVELHLGSWKAIPQLTQYSHPCKSAPSKERCKFLHQIKKDFCRSSAFS